MGEVKVNAILRNYGNVWVAQKGYIKENEIQSSSVKTKVIY
jgi:hypothetical protein|tara:strand:- start:110 stop:232 length:123 start_codon:yes stop_codon:yes gene_type:complete